MDDQSDDLRRPASARIEVFAGTGRKRWSDQVKAQIVVESFAPGAVVTQVARRHGCRPQQVHDWRRLAREGLLELPVGAMVPPTMTRKPDANAQPPFAPVLLEPCATLVSSADEWVIEIAEVKIRVRGPMQTATLAALIAALRGRTD